MKGLDLLEIEQWEFGSFIGYDHSFFTLNKEVIFHTWIMIGLMVLLFLPVKYALSKKESVARFLLTSFIESFVDLSHQTLGYFSFKHISFIVSLFIFITFANTISVIPWLGEPTADVNTTLALGLISFMYVQINAIAHHGIKAYLKEYIMPFFVMLPLNVVGKIASVVSISFRLFGNIFAGSIITNLYFTAIGTSTLFQILGLISGVNLIITIFFSLFEGFLQAFVFAMLTMTYLSIALQNEDENSQEAIS